MVREPSFGLTGVGSELNGATSRQRVVYLPLAYNLRPSCSFMCTAHDLAVREYCIYSLVERVIGRLALLSPVSPQYLTIRLHF